MALLPPSPIGQPPGNSFWNDWYEKLRTIINTGAITVAWANVTGTPTTLAGYGITNGQTLLVNSAGLAAALSDETGTGLAVFNNGPTFIAPILGTPASGNLANCTGYPTGSLSGVVGPANGGTGVANNAASTITISGAFASTFTMTGVTSVTFPTSGTLMTTTGNTTGSAGTVTTAAQPAITSVGTLTSLTMSGAISGTTDLTTTGNTILGNAQTDTLNVGNGDMIKDSSGNLGLGVAPTTKLDMFGNYALIRNASYQMYIGTGTLTTGAAAANPCFRSDTGDIYFSFGGTTRAILSSAGLLTTNSTTLHATSVALANGAGASAGTLGNAPAAGNPTKWIGINDNGTTRYIPAW